MFSLLERDGNKEIYNTIIPMVQSKTFQKMMEMIGIQGFILIIIKFYSNLPEMVIGKFI